MKSKIYAILKKNGAMSPQDISSSLGVPKASVLKIVREEISNGFIVEKDGKFTVRSFLMPPVQRPAMGLNWDLETILKLKAEAESLPESSMIPCKEEIAPRQQGDRGTCVGQSTSEAADYIHILLTGQKPTGTIQRNVQEGTAIRDILYDTSFSAQAIYEWSRKEGNVTYPSGSYCSAAIRAWNKVGICPESLWYTSKTSYGVWDTPYPASEVECKEEAAKHKLSGYAAITTLTALKSCLAKTKVAIGAINIYSNYMAQGQVVRHGVLVYDGNLPDPKGDVIGSHALCWIGYDDNSRKLFFRHSWEGWEEFGSISYDYWEKAGGDFWAPLDDADTLIGQKVYKSVTFSVIPEEAAKCAVLTINGVQRPETLPAKIALEKGSSAIVEVSAEGYKTQSVTINPVSDETSDVEFVLETDGAKTVPLWESIVKFILAIIELLRRK